MENEQLHSPKQMPDFGKPPMPSNSQMTPNYKSKDPDML
jgi:hypothetical protein